MTTSPKINSNSSSTAGRGFLFIPLVLVCFALAPVVRAVTPAPDGGYPGSNTAEGTQALFSRTTGVWNTALGYRALYHDTSGSSNTATGLQALFSNTTGKQNTATGVYALLSNTTGNFNIATGYQALLNNTIGEKNVANGYQALNTNTTGDFNTASGYQALLTNESGNYNTAIGWQALLNTTGSQNTAIGNGALSSNTTGAGNTALGRFAGTAITTASNVIAIGIAGDNVSSSCFIGFIRGVTTANADAIPVLIDSDGQLGTASSSRRYKHDIKAMEQASQSILALKPVTFHYKSDSKGTPQFGLIAEEVAEVNPDLVVRDENGEIYTVRYEAVNAMLLNEFLKEHRRVQVQEATIAQLKQDFQCKLAEQQKQINSLTSGLEKVNNQLELSKAAPRTVNNQ